MGLVYLPILIYHKSQPNVGKYTGPMHPMGHDVFFTKGAAKKCSPPVFPKISPAGKSPNLSC